MLTRHKRAGTSKFVHNHETTSTGILLFAALDWKSTRRFTDKLVTISKKHYSTTLLKNPTRDPNSKIQRPSIKHAIWNIPEHSGTSRNIPEHPGTSNNYHNYEKKMCKTRSPSPGACNFHTASVKRRFHK